MSPLLFSWEQSLYLPLFSREQSLYLPCSSHREQSHVYLTHSSAGMFTLHILSSPCLPPTLSSAGNNTVIHVYPSNTVSREQSLSSPALQQGTIPVSLLQQGTIPVSPYTLQQGTCLPTVHHVYLTHTVTIITLQNNPCVSHSSAGNNPSISHSSPIPVLPLFSREQSLYSPHLLFSREHTVHYLTIMFILQLFTYDYLHILSSISHPSQILSPSMSKSR